MARFVSNATRVLYIYCQSQGLFVIPVFIDRCIRHCCNSGQNSYYVQIMPSSQHPYPLTQPALFTISEPQDQDRYRRIVCSSGRQCDGTWSSNVVKGSVGYLRALKVLLLRVNKLLLNKSTLSPGTKGIPAKNICFVLLPLFLSVSSFFAETENKKRLYYTHAVIVVVRHENIFFHPTECQEIGRTVDTSRRRSFRRDLRLQQTDLVSKVRVRVRDCVPHPSEVLSMPRAAHVEFMVRLPEQIWRMAIRMHTRSPVIQTTTTSILHVL